jgi:hypothetical protein
MLETGFDAATGELRMSTPTPSPAAGGFSRLIGPC